MVWIAGADGCPKGWFRAARSTATGELRFNLVATAAELLAVDLRPAILAIDIPIGLPDSGSRICDTLARRFLGRPRASSVFPAPIRPALHAATRLEASEITEAADGRGVAAQSYGIYRKVREVDELLQSDPPVRDIVHEVHPEISFAVWAGGAIKESKKSKAGFLKRQDLAGSWLGADILKHARGNRPKQDLADDDILDAIAILRTAERIADGTAVSLPGKPPVDATGLPMRIVY
jgi:predicted RNase H-like nuclease